MYEHLLLISIEELLILQIRTIEIIIGFMKLLIKFRSMSNHILLLSMHISIHLFTMRIISFVLSTDIKESVYDTIPSINQSHCIDRAVLCRRHSRSFDTVNLNIEESLMQFFHPIIIEFIKPLCSINRDRVIIRAERVRISINLFILSVTTGSHILLVNLKPLATSFTSNLFYHISIRNELLYEMVYRSVILTIIMIPVLFLLKIDRNNRVFIYHQMLLTSIHISPNDVEIIVWLIICFTRFDILNVNQHGRIFFRFYCIYHISFIPFGLSFSQLSQGQ